MDVLRSATGVSSLIERLCADMLDLHWSGRPGPALRGPRVASSRNFQPTGRREYLFALKVINNIKKTSALRKSKTGVTTCPVREIDILHKYLFSYK